MTDQRLKNIEIDLKLARERQAAEKRRIDEQDRAARKQAEAEQIRREKNASKARAQHSERMDQILAKGSVGTWSTPQPSEPIGAADSVKEKFSWGKINTFCALVGLAASLYFFLVVSPPPTLINAIGLSLFGALLAAYFKKTTVTLIVLYVGYKVLLFF